MSAATQTQVTLPPRPLVRTFWSLHKAAYRLTRGRMGLQRPARGERFGMLRLHTVGRRSGEERIAMLGYFEDGPNLVTLAMNGWGMTEPAWWLNLQASPAASVDTPDGRRDVRARAATGTERDRLWEAFRDYPGWGDDLGALSARRPGETAIVVFEPAQGPARMSEATIRRASAGQGRRLRRRHLWLVPGLAIAVYANTLGQSNGATILELIAFGIAPDVPRLFGRRGRPVHNLFHQPILPAVAVGIAATGVVPVFWLVGALVWLSHVVIGWGVGDVPRTDR